MEKNDNWKKIYRPSRMVGKGGYGSVFASVEKDTIVFGLCSLALPFFFLLILFFLFFISLVTQQRALKVIPTKSERQKKDVFDEICALQNLNHANIIKYFGCLQGDNEIVVKNQPHIPSFSFEKNKNLTHSLSPPLWKIVTEYMDVTLAAAVRMIHLEEKHVSYIAQQVNPSPLFSIHHSSTITTTGPQWTRLPSLSRNCPPRYQNVEHHVQPNWCHQIKYVFFFFFIFDF